MLFDFIFETKDLPDGIKALLARLQIPVLKAAMLDGAFFAKKSHPSRLLVNALAAGGTRLVAGDGAGRSAVQEDRARSSTGSSTTSPTISRSSTSSAIELEAFLAEEEKAAEDEHPDDRRGDQPAATASRSPRSSPRPRSSGASRAIRCPNFLASFLRQNWQGDARAHLPAATARRASRGARRSRRSRTSSGACSPRKSPEDRRHLVALLPSLLKRLSARHAQPALAAGRARVVHGEPGRGARGGGEAVACARRRSPTAAVAEAAKVQAEMAKAAGDAPLAAKAEALAEAMTPRRAGAARSRNARSSTTTTSKSPAAWSAACGSSSRPTTASSRSPSSPG